MYVQANSGTEFEFLFPLIFLVLFAVTAYVVILKHRWDRKWIRDYLKAKGCTDITITWDFFSGLLDESNRYYTARFTNQAGERLSTHCKTNLFTGPYWEKPINFGEAPAPEESQTKPWAITKWIEADSKDKANSCRFCAGEKIMGKNFCFHCGAKL